MGPVIVPGQYERNAMAKRSAEGIPVAAGTYDQARALRLPSVPSSSRLLSGSAAPTAAQLCNISPRKPPSQAALPPPPPPPTAHIPLHPLSGPRPHSCASRPAAAPAAARAVAVAVAVVHDRSALTGRWWRAQLIDAAVSVGIPEADAHKAMRGECSHGR
jgi:hypothetical protein